MNNQIKNSFCIKPWVHTFIRSDGDMRLCCQSTEPSNFNSSQHTIKEYWNSTFLKDIRTEMLSGKLPSACAKCEKYEAENQTSLRQKSNADYKIMYPFLDKLLNHYNYPRDLPVDIECSLSNLCNLKCLMCNGNCSSALLVEEKILKIQNLNQADFNVKPKSLENLTEWVKTYPKYFTFHGGETMMIPEVKRLLSWGIENKFLADTKIRMITNSTKFDSEWFELLSKFKHLTLMISIDGIEKLNDYIRYGSDWNTIQSAVTHMKQLPNADLIIHTTLQNLNILNLDQIITWSQEQQIFFNFDPVRHNDTPEFSVNNFPKDLLLLAKQRLQKHKNFKNTFVSYDLIMQIINSAIENSTYNTPLWNKFVSSINLRDQHRKNCILDVIPELSHYWPTLVNTPTPLAQENK